jgi:voltage-gated potassium channel
MYQKTKGKVHILLHPELGESKADKFVNIFIISLIILNVLAVMIETIDSIHLKYKIYFDWFDRISVFIFTIEYILRVWSCTHDPRYKGSIKGRIKYMLTPGAIIDLLAFLPFYIHLITGTWQSRPADTSYTKADAFVPVIPANCLYQISPNDLQCFQIKDK